MCIIFLLLSLFAYAQEEFGCCFNPGAGTQITCNTDDGLVRQDLCCPQPDVNNPDFYNPAIGGPSNFNDCDANFFFENQDCGVVPECVTGCCCTINPADSLGILSEAQCGGFNTVFNVGTTDCNVQCQVPECNDGIDNDGDGCADFGSDKSCSSANDNNEGDGESGCITASTPSCDNPAFVPEITTFFASQIAGQKKVELQWQNQCTSKINFHVISRCQGEGCSNFVEIATIGENNYVDEDVDLQFSTTFKYKVVSHFTDLFNEQSKTTTVTLGDQECENVVSNDVFCIGKNAFTCSNNILSSPLILCGINEVCIVKTNPSTNVKNAECVLENPICNLESANPFGLYATQQECEFDSNRDETRFCYFDRSISPVNSCFACSSEMTCYDFKSEETCVRDNCGVGNCAWIPLSNNNELGTGVCVKTNEDNCRFCTESGTEGLATTDSTNSVFEACSSTKTIALSVPEFTCYFNGLKALSCNDITCADYVVDDNLNNECSSNIGIDNFNQLTNPSQDRCGLGVCEVRGNSCRKNTDGDGQPDCVSGDISCEQDVFAPDTTIIPEIERGIFKKLLIEIVDKTSNIDSLRTRTSSEYKTFICLEPCNRNKHPFDISTTSTGLTISNKKVFDDGNGNILLNLNEGPNTIKYYSQDPAKNLGRIKTIDVTATNDITGPIVERIDITNGREVNEVIHTRSLKPAITVEFFESAFITSAELIEKSSNANLPLIFNINLFSETHPITIPQTLALGKYTLQINAKDNNGVFIDGLFGVDIIIDNINPEIVSISPVDGEVVRISGVPFTISLNEPTFIDVALNGENATGNFTTGDNEIFSSNIQLADNSYELTIIASDFAGNQITNITNFDVNANLLEINLIEPSFGVSPQFTFDILVTTDNNANCKFNLDDQISSTSMTPFEVTGEIEHRINFFTQISVNDRSIHRLRVFCDDFVNPQKLEIFELSVDDQNPIIIEAFANPNPIVDEPRTTTLKIQADKETICKFSDNSNGQGTQIFDNMEGKFPGFDDNLFSTINTKEITVDTDGFYRFFVACISKAELISLTSEINFASDITIPLEIISHTDSFSSSSTITLAVSTNKNAQCKFSENLDFTPSTIFGPTGKDHTRQLTNLDGGLNTFFVSCIDSSLQFSPPIQIDFTIDTTVPIMLFVDDSSDFLDPQITCLTNTLIASWLAEDLEVDVNVYTVSIIEKPTNEKIVDNRIFELPGHNGEIQRIDDLTLRDQTDYFFEVFATNVLSLTSTPLASDGVRVNTLFCPDLICGDGKIDPGEACDKNDGNPGNPVFGSINNKCTDNPSFIGGTLRCDDNCQLDIGLCVGQQACGDRIIQSGEHCDSNRFGVIDSCIDLGFSGGTLNCAPNCFLDTRFCIPPPLCGNGIIDPGEDCDGSNLGSLDGTCTQYNPAFTSGTLRCSNNCKLETIGCLGFPGLCDGQQINPGESCDGTNFGAANSCTDLGFESGNLNCNGCRLDTTQCQLPQACGNGNIDSGEECDGTNLGSASTSCSEYSSFFVSGDIFCDQNCKLNTFFCGEAPTCGNGFIDVIPEEGIIEECDGNNFGQLDGTCRGFGDAFLSGTLACNPVTCQIDTSQCTQPNLCGNNVLEPGVGELCDGSDFGSTSTSCSVTFPVTFESGTITCKPAGDANECQLDTTACVEIPPCGNGVIDTGEQCDGTLFVNENECIDFPDLFESGLLNCNPPGDANECQLDTSACIEVPTCGNNIVQRGEECDGIAFGAIDECTDFSNFIGGNLGCTVTCGLDLLGCIDVPTCGNGVIDISEDCDGSLFGSINECTDYPEFTSGNLFCNPVTCQLETTQCRARPTCGNGIIDSGESCDGIDFGPLDGTCTNFKSDFLGGKFTGGNLLCTSNCQLSTENCQGTIGVCGDNIINIGEECDGVVFGTIDECNDFSDFTSGPKLFPSHCSPGSIMLLPQAALSLHRVVSSWQVTELQLKIPLVNSG